MRLRAITTGINTRLGPPEIASILDRTRPRVVIRDADLDAVRAAYTYDPPVDLPRVEPDDAGRDRLDERHDGHAEGRGVRPSQPPSGRDRRGRDGRAVRRAPRAASVRARRVHVAAVGGDRQRDHDGDHADAVERGRRAPADGARTCDRRSGRTDAVAARARPSRLREQRPVEPLFASRGRARRRFRPSSCARWSSGSAVRWSSATRAPRPRSRPARFRATRPR